MQAVLWRLPLCCCGAVTPAVGHSYDAAIRCIVPVLQLLPKTNGAKPINVSAAKVQAAMKGIKAIKDQEPKFQIQS